MRSATTSCDSFTLLRSSTRWKASTSEKMRHLGQRGQAVLGGLLDGRPAQEDVAPGHPARGELLAGLLVLLVLEQAPDERLARVDLVLGIGLVLLTRAAARAAASCS